MRKFVTALALLALASVPAFAQVPGVPLNDVTSAVDTDPALVIWFVGDDTTGVVTAAVESDGNITLVQAGAADTTVECPLSGAYGGVIDVSDAACDTLGEVVSVINGTSGSEWRAAIVNGFASDSANDTLLAASAAEARGDGIVALWDSSVKLSAQVGFFPGYLDAGSIKPKFFYLNESNRGVLRDNPFKGAKQTLKYAHENITSSGTVANFVVTCVVPNFQPSGSYAETATNLYLEAGAATTATGLISEFNYAGGGLVCEDGKIVVRQSTGTDLTAQVVFANGFSEQK